MISSTAHKVSWIIRFAAPLLLAGTPLAAFGQEETQDEAILKRFRGEMVHIQAGSDPYPASFRFGQLGAEPGSQVRGPEPYWIGKYEIPQNLWEVVMGENPSRWKGERNSVEMLSLDESIEFCERLTGRLRKLKLIEDDQLIRLPTELEWEYAIRAGSVTDYSYGNDAEALGDYAWFTGNAAGNDPPVGAKKPNAWKLYDGHGYLSEYCLPTQSAATSPRWNTGEWAKIFAEGQAVIRSGSWKDPADALRSGFRRVVPRTTRDDAIGLRCVLVGPLRPHPIAGFKPQAQSEVLPTDAKLEWLWNEGEFTEGPAAAPDGSIYFSDIGNRLLRFDPVEQSVTVVREPSGRSNGLMFNAAGQLVICEGANTGGGRRISIGPPQETPRILSTGYQGKQFNSPNDLVIDSQDNVYITDPRYVGDEPRELDFEAVFLIKPDGTTTIATSEVSKPNGIVLSPDGRWAYVADHHPDRPKQLLRFAIQESGELTDKQVLFDFGVSRGIDGMTIDTQGYVYATAGSGLESGIYVFDPSGKPMAFIPTPGAPTNCVFGGGKDSNWLYITSEGPEPKSLAEPRRYGLGRIRLDRRGFHVTRFDE